MRLLIALVLVILVVVFLPEFSGHVVPGSNTARTTSMDMVEIVLEPDPDMQTQPETRGPRLKIARAFLTDPRTWKGGKQRRVVIETGLPDFQPRVAIGHPSAPASTPERAAQMRELANGLLIWLEASPPGLKNLDAHWTSESDASAKRLGRVERDPIYGLRRIDDVPCMADYVIEQRQRAGAAAKPCDTAKPTTEYYFAFDADGHATVRIECVPLWIEQGTSCMTYFLHKGMVLKAVFRNSELQRWREFVEGARNLVDAALARSA